MVCVKKNKRLLLENTVIGVFRRTEIGTKAGVAKEKEAKKVKKTKQKERTEVNGERNNCYSTPAN